MLYEIKHTMKKLFFYIIAIIILLMVAGAKGFCQSVMTMTIKQEIQPTKIKLAGSGSVTIDWGDGKKDNIAISATLSEFVHFYPDSNFYSKHNPSIYAITIIGESVKTMGCSYLNLTSLDVSKNRKLEYLYCRNNSLTYLDLSKNTLLKYLSCANNQLTNLDVSKNKALKDLDCHRNQLSELNISKNKALTEMYCDGNKLLTLDISKNKSLTILDCYNNKYDYRT